MDIIQNRTLARSYFSLYAQLVNKYPQLKFVANSDVNSIEDLQKLANIGLYGTTVGGKAIHENIFH